MCTKVSPILLEVSCGQYCPKHLPQVYSVVSLREEHIYMVFYRKLVGFIDPSKVKSTCESYAMHTLAVLLYACGYVCTLVRTSTCVFHMFM
jgi:hypothetical protein